MNIRLHQRLLIPASLTLLFASGIAAGYFWGRQTPAHVIAERTKAQAEALTPEQWAENAVVALQKDIELTDEQANTIRRGMSGPAHEIFGEKRMADFKIHLRLLGLHDNLGQDSSLSGHQRSALKQRREQLRRHILEKFKDLANPQTDPLLNNL